MVDVFKPVSHQSLTDIFTSDMRKQSAWTLVWLRNSEAVMSVPAAFRAAIRASTRAPVSVEGTGAEGWLTGAWACWEEGLSPSLSRSIKKS